MTKRYLQEKYSLDDEECARPRRSFPCQECYGMYGQHQANCPNAPDEPEQEEE